MHPAPTSLKQKISLFVLGLAFTIILLELLLRLGGSAYLYWQDRFNRADLGDSKTYRILCLGESTTAFGGDQFSYPAQLQRILNEKNLGVKFKVINKGIPGVNTHILRNRIDSFLSEYQPHVVVTMMGINDEHYYLEFGEKVEEQAPSFWDSLRVRKLALLIGAHWKHRSDEKIRQVDNSIADENTKIEKIFANIKKLNEEAEQVRERFAPAQAPDSESGALRSENLKKVTDKKIELLIIAGQWFEDHGMPQDAEKSFEQAYLLDPSRPEGLIELGLHLKSQGDSTRSLEMFKRAILLDPLELRGYLELARGYVAWGEPEEANQIFERILSTENGGYWFYIELGDWFVKRKSWGKAQEAFSKALALEPKNSIVYEKLANVYLQLGKRELAQEFEEKAKAGKAAQYQEVTIKNYDSISEKVLKRGARLIVMQYPMRDIDSLRQRLRLRERITFVENRENFTRALASSNYSEYFYDYFAGDFGHCTAKGNRLIAENLAEAIVREIQ